VTEKERADKLERALFRIIELHIDESRVGLVPGCRCGPCKIARAALILCRQEETKEQD